MLAGQCACALLLAAALAGCAWQPPQGAIAAARHPCQGKLYAAGGDFYDYLEARSLIRHLERRGKLSPCAPFMLAAGFAERRHLAE